MFDRFRLLVNAPELGEPAWALIQNWTKRQVGLRAPASLLSLWRLDRRLRWRLPSDFIALYRRANGMFYRDELMVSMWSVEQILRQQPLFGPLRSMPVGTYLFADVCADTYFFGLDDCDRVSICAESMVRPIGTFAEFLYLYWADPRSLGLNDREVAA